MWPIDTKQCLKQLKTYNSSRKVKIDEPTLPRTSIVPRTSTDVERGLERWNQHLGPRCSSPSRPEWDSFIQGSLQVLTQTQLQEQELQIHQNKRISDLEQKITKRQRVCKYGPFTGKEALEMEEKKRQKEKKEQFKKQQQIKDKLWRAERDEIHQQGLETRKREQERKKEVKALQKAKQAIPPKLQVPIPDPEIVWKADQAELKKLFPSPQLNENEDENEIEIIVNTAGDKSLQDSIALQHNYIPLLENSDDLSSSSSKKSEELDYNM